MLPLLLQFGVLSYCAVNFGLGGFVLGSNAVVKVPITGLRVTLDQPHPNTVTLTPNSASLQFIPSSFVFEPAVSEVCVTVIPQTPLDSETIVFSSSDPTNYIAPDPVTFGPISQSTLKKKKKLLNIYLFCFAQKLSTWEISLELSAWSLALARKCTPSL